jgi:plastocyanin
MQEVRKAFVTAVAVVAVASVGGTGVAAAQSQGKTIPVTLSGVYFDGHANATAKGKVGDKLVFKWKDGVHNVVSQAIPAGAKKTNSGAPKAGHAPLTVSLTKKGTYNFICQPHEALGMKLKVTVS